ncbi:MAG: hypothetical protein JRJ23_07875 [Deltaproteobacteria bacterium]|nr:hypothetical protein [Deltaproteobacteria bacterium]
MKKIVLALFIILITTNTLAQDDTGFGFARLMEKPVAVSLSRPADHVSLKVIISSSKQDRASQIKEIASARQHLLEIVEQNPDIILYSGSVQLSSDSATFLSLVKDHTDSLRVEVHLLLPMEKYGRDIFQGALKLLNSIEMIRPPGNSSYTVTEIQLAAKNPEQYRVVLMEMINEEIYSIQASLAETAKVTLGGLENPIQIRQIDNRQIELFIDYNLEIETAPNQ